MPTLTISPSYSDGAVLTKAQIDTLVDPITTFVNTTKLDSVNVDIQDVIDGLTSSESGIIFSQAGLGSITESTVTATATTSTFASITTVTAPTAGDYLILLNGVASSRETSTAGSTQWGGYIYFEFRNTTTTTSISPTISIGQTVYDAAVSLNDLQTRRVDQHVTYSYITTLAASDVVAVRAYHDPTNGTSDSYFSARLTLLRLVQ